MKININQLANAIRYHSPAFASARSVRAEHLAPLGGTERNAKANAGECATLGTLTKHTPRNARVTADFKFSNRHNSANIEIQEQPLLEVFGAGLLFRLLAWLFLRSILKKVGNLKSAVTLAFRGVCLVRVSR